MRKIYLLTAVAAIALVGCKNNGAKKAAEAVQDAEQVAVTEAESIQKAIEAVEADETLDAREAVEKLSAATAAGTVESVKETLEKNPDAVIPVALVETKPSFNGGDANDFSKWVNENLVYPKDAIDQNISGRVILQFTVDKEGAVKDVKVLKGVDEVLDNEAVRVVTSSPNWTPANQNGVPVSVNYTFPVVFKLN